MFRELASSSFSVVAPLLETMTHNLSPAAVVEGSSPGRIWADDPERPSLALLDTPEGHFLAGRRPTGKAAEALHELIAGTVYARALAEGWWHLCLHYPEPDWQDAIAASLGEFYPVWDYQQCFVLERLERDWREGVPEGFVIRRVDLELLGRDDLANVDRLRSYATSNFGTLERFVENGFGFCAVRGEEIACWCMADCVSGDRGEVGIHTVEQYRRRGLATRTVAAAAEHCFAHGLKQVGWHCWSSNLASAATARAVGFVKARDHHAVHGWVNHCDGLLTDGNLHLMRGQYAEAAQRYERALAQVSALDRSASQLLVERSGFASYAYRAACAAALSGRREAAAGHLETAFEAGTERWMGY